MGRWDELRFDDRQSPGIRRGDGTPGNVSSPPGRASTGNTAELLPGDRRALADPTGHRPTETPDFARREDVGMTDEQRMTNEEWQARQDLAAAYRIFAMMGWDELIYTHVTVKIPNEAGAFLINPFGLQFTEVQASNLVKIDIDGNKLCGSDHRVNRAGFVQHSVFHRDLPDAHCIIHTHTTATAAVCSMKGGLQPVNFYACGLVGKISYHDFEGVTVREEESQRLLANLGHNRILMLRNHGPVVIGESLPAALVQYWALQRACEIQLATMQAGTPITVAQEVIDVHQRDLHLACDNGPEEFDSWVRQIDKIDPTWRN